MATNNRPSIAFPLRLAASLKDRAKILSSRDGISLNHFINLAVAERVSRLELTAVREFDPLGKQKIPSNESYDEKRPLKPGP